MIMYYGDLFSIIFFFPHSWLDFFNSRKQDGQSVAYKILAAHVLPKLACLVVLHTVKYFLGYMNRSEILAPFPLQELWFGGGEISEALSG